MRRKYTNKKDALYAFRWNRVWKNKILWFLFVISILLSILCPIFTNTLFDQYFYPVTNAILNGLSNISFGYLSGFLVYLFSSFFPDTKREVEIKDSIYFNLFLISETLNIIDNDFIPDDIPISRKEYESKLYNYLVANGNTLDVSDKKTLPTTAYINIKCFFKLSRRLSLIKEEVDNLISSYGREMDSSEIEYLNKLSGLYSSFMKSADDIKSTYIEDYFDIFIMDFISYGHVQFKHIWYEYERFKYCDYNITRTKITYANDK